MRNYIVATLKSWNIEQYQHLIQKMPGNWYLMDSPEQLSIDKINEIQPEFIFFPHWSYKIPQEIFSAYECVVFHMTNVPFGRGGSPLQNLISRGVYQTKIVALKCEEELDAGPVYLRRDFYIEHGSAAEIYQKAAEIVFAMIEEIIQYHPLPEEQTGEVVYFPRRSPEMSEFKEDFTLKQMYDHIRMLDAEGYPNAFISYGDYRLTMTQADLCDNELSAQLVIKKYKKNDHES
ncbi:MAG: methionyl-tRNA formyltransferase [gamma proteobacterium symbiont of Taylorina sp.]|nr:methionyl-tRNA formyltransferase [gamma proteobacterium symbiont of Taylorina sp.]